MFEIECPKCHTVFEEDESKFAHIVRQVRDREFQKELDAQVRLMEEARRLAVAEAEARGRAAAQEGVAGKDRRIAELEARLEGMEQRMDAQRAQLEGQAKLAVSQATAALEHERDDFRHRAELADLDRRRLEQSLAEQRREATRQVEQAIQMKNDEIEQIKSFQSKLTIKMVGESLEQHCEIEFNKWEERVPPGALRQGQHRRRAQQGRLRLP